nr:MAG TPA: hypothetical protein [Caudoviricetes sp.]
MNLQSRTHASSVPVARHLSTDRNTSRITKSVHNLTSPGIIFQTIWPIFSRWHAHHAHLSQLKPCFMRIPEIFSWAG